MSDFWNNLPAEQKLAIRAVNRRQHSSAAGEARMAVEDARTALMLGIIDWLRERGHGAAANDLADHGFEPEAGN